jgi:ABC-type bacteriocin/lantibiotic exporter with double-glycine peptidase domain
MKILVEFLKLLNIIGFNLFSLIKLIILFFIAGAGDLIGLLLLGEFVGLVLYEKDSPILAAFNSIIEYPKEYQLYVFAILVSILQIFKFVVSLVSLKNIYSSSEFFQWKLKILLIRDFCINGASSNASIIPEAQYNINIATNTVSQKVFFAALKFFSDAISIFSLLLLLFLVDWEVTLYGLIGTLLIALVFKISLGKRVSNLGVVTNEYGLELLHTVNNGLYSLNEFTASGNTSVFEGISNIAAKRYSEVAALYSWLNLIPRYSIEIILVLSFCLFLPLLNEEVITNGVAELSIVLFALLRLMPIISSLVTSFLQVGYGLEAYYMLRPAVVRAILRGATLDPLIQEDGTTAHSVQKLTEIELSKLIYKVDELCVLSSPKMKIVCGSRVFITGPSGAGKSTFLDIIANLKKPFEGEVRFLTEDSTAPASMCVYYLPQNPFIFTGSILDNITLNLKSDYICKDRLDRALRLSGLDKVMHQTGSLSLDTHLVDGGKNLSGGQKQRIAIARAIYADRKVLLLDEATSGLEEGLEQEIVQQLVCLPDEYIVLFVSHNQSLRQFFDKHIYIKPMLRNGSNVTPVF